MPDEKRMASYEFNSIYTIEDEIELNIPGYKVKDLPQAMNMQASDYSFSGSYTPQTSKIVLKKQLSITTGTVKKSDFTNWSEFLKKLRDFNNNIVVVEKDPNYVAPKETAPAAATPTKPATTKPGAVKPAVKATTPAKKPAPKH